MLYFEAKYDRKISGPALAGHGRVQAIWADVIGALSMQRLQKS